MMPTILIGGQWVSDTPIAASINPATQATVGEYSIASKHHVSAAVTAARRAFPEWSAMPLPARARILQGVSQLIAHNSTRLAALITSEMGKPITESSLEVDETSRMVQQLACNAEQWLTGELRAVDTTTHKLNYTSYHPLGVVSAIKPWNYPFELPAWSIASAMLAGNSVVFKPSEYTPLVASELVRCFCEAGVPDGILNLLQGGPDVARALLAERPECVSFTGSTAAGRDIARQMAPFPSRLILELGGKDAFIVCRDADLELAARGAVWGAFSNCGQVCTASARIIVVRDVAQAFIRLFKSYTESLTVGDPSSPSVDVGPLVSETARRKIENQIAEAVAGGAHVLTGGRRPSASTIGFFLLPTIVIDVDPAMSLWQAESFGPVAPIIIVDDEHEAVKLANESSYDLGASLWTKSLSNALSLSRLLRTGMIWVNDVNVAFPNAPWGGFFKSGHSKELSRRGLLEYSAESFVSIDFSDEHSRPWWFPYRNAGAY